LFVINLSNNLLGGSLDNISWGAFSPNLQTLDLSSNLLYGTIPDSIGQIQNIKSLLLDSNLLYGTLPAGLQELTSIGYLGLMGNNLTGTAQVLEAMMTHQTFASDLFNTSLCCLMDGLVICRLTYICQIVLWILGLAFMAQIAVVPFLDPLKVPYVPMEYTH